MASAILLPHNTYPVGSRSLGPATIPSGITGFELRLDGASMTDPALQLAITVDLSLDGGATWASEAQSPATDPFPVAITAVGGAKDRQGNPVAIYNVGVRGIPSPSSSTRKLRATLTITGAPLTTSGTLITSP